MLKDIVLAALLHDVGKFAERGQPEEFAALPDAEVADYGYPHAAATERFLTEYVHYDGRQPPWFNYATMHHKPSDNSPMEWMIAEADHLSSGMERASYAAEERDSGQQKFKTPLKPVTEFIALQETEPIDGQYYFPLKTLQPDELNVFPRKMPADLDLTQDYRTLFKQFTIEFEKLVKYGIEAKIDTLYFLLQKFWWAVPSTTRKHDFPDISLLNTVKRPPLWPVVCGFIINLTARNATFKPFAIVNPKSSCCSAETLAASRILSTRFHPKALIPC